MDYEKKYKEALERAKGVVEQNPLMEYLKKGIEYILPELKESEDEKIRKSIIENLKGNMCRTDGDYDLLNKQITWLEKQGEKKQDPCNNCKDVMLNCHNFPCIKKRAFKQGKSVLEAIIDEKVDNQNYVKTVDKAEPKFKQGQWIIWLGKCYKVNYNGCGYELVNRNGLSTLLEYETVDISAHLWDITKDVKDGDVLAKEPIKGCNSPFVAIYKGQSEEDFNSYCFIGFDGKFYKGENYHYIEEVHPATKEQRDTLMKAMSDAGFTFDFEKKELKKIEQKSVEWSEEDKVILDEIIDFFENGTVKLQHDLSLYAAWLKSLKDRYTWKPSEEQLDALQYVYRNLNPPLSDKLGWNSLKTLELMYHDLKKLK